MSFVDTLTVNILLAKAEKAGADPDRSWPIVIFGPSSPSYRLKAPILGPMIMTLNNDVVTVAIYKNKQEVARLREELDRSIADLEESAAIRHELSEENKELANQIKGLRMQVGRLKKNEGVVS